LETLDDAETPAAVVTGVHRDLVHDTTNAGNPGPTGLILGLYRADRLLVSRRRMRRLRSWVEETAPDRLVLKRRLFRLGWPRACSRWIDPSSSGR
jgi:hypothetical protein